MHVSADTLKNASAGPAGFARARSRGGAGEITGGLQIRFLEGGLKKDQSCCFASPRWSRGGSPGGLRLWVRKSVLGCLERVEGKQGSGPP